MKVAVVLGSRSDINIAEETVKVLREFGVEYKVYIASAHRTPERVKEIVDESGAEIFIAIAGLSAGLPGIIASHTTRPVIGVPVSGKLNLDSILSILQMPPGIPVATVGLDNGRNAALLAVEILGLSDEGLKVKVNDHREEMRKRVIEDSKSIEL